MRLGPDSGDLVGRHAGAHQGDGGVHPLPRLLEGVPLGLRGPADRECPVVAGAVAVEDVDDVEIGLVAGPQQAVGEHVWVGAAALAGNGVDGLHAFRAHVEEMTGCQPHDLALADARLECLEDVLVGAVDHGAGLGEEHDLVGALDLACQHHQLLAVAHVESLRLQLQEDRCLRRVHPDGVGRQALAGQDVADLRHGGGQQPRARGDGPCKPVLPPREFRSSYSPGNWSRCALAAEPKSQIHGPPSRVTSAYRSPLLKAQ